MPLTKADRASLERHLKAHAKDVSQMGARRKAMAAQIEARESGQWSDPNPKKTPGIKVLTEQLAELDREIELHLALIELGRNEAVLKTLGDLVDDPKLVDKAARDPKRYAAKQGIKLPATMELSLRQVNDHPQLTVFNYDRLAPLHLVWDNNGFTVIQ